LYISSSSYAFPTPFYLTPENEFNSPVVQEMWKSKSMIYAIFIIVSDLEDR
jgi:hypothetical protein